MKVEYNVVEGTYNVVGLTVMEFGTIMGNLAIATGSAEDKLYTDLREAAEKRDQSEH